jgi:hypothetical protein
MTRIVTTTYRYKRPPPKRKAAPEQSTDAAYWLSTDTNLKNPTPTLHLESCSTLRRSRWRALRALTGPLTWAQIAILPDQGYRTCGLCKPTGEFRP